jgi:3-oxoacyl-[acyl-carrier protein] reductase
LPRERFLVSGGSGGIGAAVCDALAARGLMPIVAYASGRERAEAVARRTEGLALALDLRSPEAIDRVVAAIASEPDPLIGVVLAGSPPPDLVPFGKITPDELARQWQVNVLGPQLLLAQLVRQCFRKRKRGAIVGVLTKAMGDRGRGAASGMGSYVIAKFGLAGVLAAAAADYPWLRVRSVSPGYTETPMLAAFDERFLAMQRERAPFETPEEVASIIVEEALGE